MKSNHIEFPILTARGGFALKQEAPRGFFKVQKCHTLPICDEQVPQGLSDRSKSEVSQRTILGQDGFYT